MGCSTQRRWIATIGLALACVGTPQASAPTPSEPTPTPTPLAEVARLEIQPTPLVELDADAIAALPERPKPVESAPFDDAMRARIAAVQPIVAAAAAKYAVEPALINAVIYVESKFDPKARGGKAQGLMQLMPKTAAALAKQMGRSRNSYDPDFNIHAGTLLLSQLLKRFDGDLTLALAGYNRGSGTVAKWVAAGEPLPEGTQGFVDRVLRAKAWFP